MTLVGAYGGQMLGTVFLSAIAAPRVKAAFSYPANQPFVFSDERTWRAAIAIANNGGATADFASYQLCWESNGPAYAETSGGIWFVGDLGNHSYVHEGNLPAIAPGASASIDIAFGAFQMYPSYEDEYWSDQRLLVTLADRSGKVWEDAVTIRFFTEPLVITFSAGGDFPFCLISPTDMAQQFGFPGPVDFQSVSVPRAAGWRIGVSGAGLSSGYKYSIGVAYPSLSLEGLSRSSVDAEAYEPNDAEAAAAELPDYGRIEAWLSPGELDFYSVDATTPASRFPFEEVEVPGGAFTLGVSGGAYNGPARLVTVSSFIMTKTEVTRGQLFEAAGYPYFTPTELMQPAETFKPMANMSWYDAAELCDIVSRSQGLEPVYGISRGQDGYIVTEGVSADFSKSGWRLPTEAEWEYAARGGEGGSDSLYAGSDTASEVAWYGEHSTWTDYHVVGLKKPNALGLYDMSGNLSEWTNDWYAYGYPEGNATDPTGPSTESKPYTQYDYKAVRGGSVDDPTYTSSLSIEVKARDAKEAGQGNTFVGFRMVRRAP